MTEAIIGYGTKVTVATAAGASTFFELGEVTGITPPNESVDQIDSTHMQSPGRTREFIQGLINPGEMSVEFNHIPGSLTDDFLIEWRASGETRLVVITYPNNITDTFPAFILGYAPSMAVADKLAAEMSLKVAGAVVRGTV